MNVIVELPLADPARLARLLLHWAAEGLCRVPLGSEGTLAIVVDKGFIPKSEPAAALVEDLDPSTFVNLRSWIEKIGGQVEVVSSCYKQEGGAG